MVLRASHGDLGVDEHLIGDGRWQRVLEALRQEPYMHPTYLGRLRRFVVLRRNCTWAKIGLWNRLLQRSQPVAGLNLLHIESTAIKCHRTATGAHGSGEEAIGRSRGGLSTKVHHASQFASHNCGDSLGFVRRLLTSHGQHADCRHAAALTGGLKPVAVVADKAYDTDTLRGHWGAQGISNCVPSKCNRLVQHAYNEALYRTRHMVENSFCHLKDHARLSLRLDKTETSFRAFAALLINLKLKPKLCN